MAELAPADKAVLLLFLDDVGYDEMAAILGVSAGALACAFTGSRIGSRNSIQGQTP